MSRAPDSPDRLTAEINQPDAPALEVHAHDEPARFADGTSDDSVALGGLSSTGARSGDGAPAPPRRTWLDVMGIALDSPTADDDVVPVSEEPSPSRIVDNELPVFEPAAAGMAQAPEAPGAASEEPGTATTGSADSTLVTQVYEDQARALERRLYQQQAEHGRVIEAVARGEADSSEIARSRGEMRATRDELEDIAALQAHVEKVAAERAARNKVLAYHQVVDTTEAAMVQALDTAQTIDECVDALGAAVGRFRTQVQLCDELQRVTYVAGGRRLLDDVSTWSSQRAALDSELLNRLRSVGALTDRSVDDRARERRVASWTQSWTVRMIEIARQRGPSLPDDEGAEERHYD
jgi:phage shock protein A